MLIILFICPFFFVSHKNQSELSPAIRARLFTFCINPDSCEVYYVRENRDAEIFFSFAHLFHAIVREIRIYKISSPESDSCGRGM